MTRIFKSEKGELKIETAATPNAGAGRTVHGSMSSRRAGEDRWAVRDGKYFGTETDACEWLEKFVTTATTNNMIEVL